MNKMTYIGSVMVAMTQAGELSTTPIIFPLSVTDNSITAKQTATEQKFLGECCGKKVVFGAKEVSGSLGGTLTSSNAQIVYQYMFGVADTTENSTADAWASTTVYGFGDIVNHSDGVHTLACTKSGTSAGTEPTIGTIGKKIVDGTANWVATSLSQKLTINTNKKPRAAAIEN